MSTENVDIRITEHGSKEATSRIDGMAASVDSAASSVQFLQKELQKLTAAMRAIPSESSLGALQKVAETSAYHLRTVENKSKAALRETNALAKVYEAEELQKIKAKDLDEKLDRDQKDREHKRLQATQAHNDKVWADSLKARAVSNAKLKEIDRKHAAEVERIETNSAAEILKINTRHNNQRQYLDHAAQKASETATLRHHNILAAMERRHELALERSRERKGDTLIAMERRHELALERIRERRGDFGRRMLGVAAGAAVATFSFASIRDTLDTWTQFGNQIRIATSNMEEAKTVQSEIFDVAIKTRQDLISTAKLYNRVAMARKDLAITQRQAIDFTESIGKVLAYSGTNAQQARGALIQLSQALSGTIVRAEEYNSINEGAPEILRVVARNIKGVDGNIGRLRYMMVKGLLTSKEFFAAFESGSKDIDAAFADTIPTIDQGLNILNTRYTKWLGQTDQAIGFSSKFATTLAFLGKHIGFIGNAILSLGAGMAVAFIASIATVKNLIGLYVTLAAKITLAQRAAMANPYAAAFAGLVTLGSMLYLTFRDANEEIKPLVEKMDEFATIEQNLDQMAFVTDRYAKALVGLNKAKEAGLITEARHTELTMLARQEMERASLEASNSNDAWGKLHKELGIGNTELDQYRKSLLLLNQAMEQSAKPAWEYAKMLSLIDKKHGQGSHRLDKLKEKVSNISDELGFTDAKKQKEMTEKMAVILEAIAEGELQASAEPLFRAELSKKLGFTKDYEEILRDTEERLDPVIQAQRAFNKEHANLNDLLERGTIEYPEYIRLLGLAKQQHLKTGASAKKHKEEVDELLVAYKRLRDSLRTESEVRLDEFFEGEDILKRMLERQGESFAEEFAQGYKKIFDRAGEDAFLPPSMQKGAAREKMEELQKELLSPMTQRWHEYFERVDSIDDATKRLVHTEETAIELKRQLREHYVDLIDPMHEVRGALEEEIAFLERATGKNVDYYTDLQRMLVTVSGVQEQIAESNTKQHQAMLMNTRQREIESRWIQEATNLGEALNSVTDEEINLYKERIGYVLELTDVLSAQDSIMARTIDRQKDFNYELKALHGLRRNMPGWSNADTAIQLESMLSGFNTDYMDFGMTARLDASRVMYEQLKQLRQDDLINEQEYSALRAQVHNREMQTRLDASSQFFGNLSALQQAGIKELFYLGKAAALSQAVINTYQAVTKSYADFGGGPLGMAMAASAMVAGFTQVAAIQSQKLPAFAVGGQFTVPGAGGVDSQTVAFRASPGERVTVSTPTQARKGTGAMSETGAQVSPVVNQRIINVLDPELVGSYLATPEGEQVVVNVIRRNGDVIRRVVKNG